MTLRLASTTYRYPGARDSDVLEQLGLTAPLFWRRVNTLLDRPDALAAYPLEVRRLQRLRDRRRYGRSARRATVEV